MTGGEQLGFAIRFAQADTRAGTRARTSLQSGVLRFLKDTRRGRAKDAILLPTDHFEFWKDEAKIADLQRTTHTLLSALAESYDSAAGGHGVSPGPPGATVGPLQVDVRARADGSVDIAMIGPTRDRFLSQLVGLLMSADAARVRRCPECRTTLFYKTGRRRYCSPRCLGKATWRNYPIAKKRAARQRYYETFHWTLGARGSALAVSNARRVPKGKAHSTAQGRED